MTIYFFYYYYFLLFFTTFCYCILIYFMLYTSLLLQSFLTTVYLLFFRVNKLWWDPPQPSLISTQPPRLDRYFAQWLLLWMPRKLWKVTLYCLHEGCDRKLLTSAGIYSTVRQVVDIDSNYNLAAEYLERRHCKRKVISWSPEIINNLILAINFSSQFC